MTKTKITCLLAMTLMLSITASGILAFDFTELEKSIKDKTLDNGLKVIVVERHDAPVVSFVTWANVGSVDDPKEYTGLAHMFEHMAFKGTTTLGTKDIDKELELIAIEDSIFMQLRAERLKGRLTDSAKVAELTTAYENAREASYELVIPNEFSETITRAGGVGMNAFTANDMTAYFFSLPSNKVELWMALESERFLNPVFREMYKERDVVAEERRMRVESSPFGRLLEEFMGLAYKAHPYGIRGIGHMSDIQNYSRKEAKAFFEKYYGPSNLVICIIGDVKAKNVFKLAEKYWGRIPYRPAPPMIATVEPEQIGERRMEITDPAQPIYAVGWHIPNLAHPDRPAIDAMLDYLAQGTTSLLHKNLVKEKKIAVQVGGFSGFPGDKYPTMVLIYSIPSQGNTSLENETEILAEVEKMKKEIVSPEDLEKIKARAKAGFVNGLLSNSGLGMQLAGAQTGFGDWRKMFKQLDRINAVTSDDIKRVAEKYFTKKNRNVVYVVTETEPEQES